MSNKKKLVVVRTYSAGVHVGEFVSRNGQEISLTNARRIWSWSGALSLHEVASRGISGGKVSVAVSDILLTQAIEVIGATPKALAQIASFEVKSDIRS
jgi:hypothetical protein